MLSVVFQHWVLMGSRPGSVKGGMFLSAARQIDDSTGRRDRRRIEHSKEDERTKGKAREEGRESKFEAQAKELKVKVPLGVVKATATRWGPTFPGFSNEA